jgi:hypothetical protein
VQKPEKEVADNHRGILRNYAPCSMKCSVKIADFGGMLENGCPLLELLGHNKKVQLNFVKFSPNARLATN